MEVNEWGRRDYTKIKTKRNDFRSFLTLVKVGTKERRLDLVFFTLFFIVIFFNIERW